MPVYSYDPPDRFVAGTVGQPGMRTFYLQASAGGRVTSVALEKVQVSLLAERLDELLDEVLRRSGGQAGAPAVPALRAAARHRRAHLPTAEWPPDRQCLTGRQAGEPGAASEPARRQARNRQCLTGRQAGVPGAASG